MPGRHFKKFMRAATCHLTGHLQKIYETQSGKQRMKCRLLQEI